MQLAGISARRTTRWGLVGTLGSQRAKCRLLRGGDTAAVTMGWRYLIIHTMASQMAAFQLTQAISPTYAAHTV